MSDSGEISVSQIEQEARHELNGIETAEQLEAFRIAYLGKKGKIGLLMGRLRGLSPDEKREFGQGVNRLKVFLEDSIRGLRDRLACSGRNQTLFDETPKPQNPKLII
jgi:phenylalanyl-tRNA synthetase alpha chain